MVAVDLGSSICGPDLVTWIWFQFLLVAHHSRCGPWKHFWARSGCIALIPALGHFPFGSADASSSCIDMEIPLPQASACICLTLVAPPCSHGSWVAWVFLAAPTRRGARINGSEQVAWAWHPALQMIIKCR